MPRSWDREDWTGTEDVTVLGTARTAGELVVSASRATGYDVHGEPVEVNIAGYAPRPYLAITPLRQSFGADPEAVRARAPKRSRETIGTRAEEDQLSAATMSSCEPETALRECDDTGGAGTNYGGVVLSYRWSDCVGSFSPNYDSDFDSVLDACERTMATQFEPRLAFHVSEPWSGREPYWTVNRGTSPDRLRIFYAISYYRDAGFTSGGGTHYGDSEFIVVDVALVPGTTTRWRVLQAKLSAHYQGLIDNTGTYAGGDFAYYSGEYRVHPIVYSSYGKHANYLSIPQCGDGAGGFDDCSHSQSGVLLGAHSWYNLGGSAGPMISCTRSRSSGLTGQECYWAYNDDFAGWFPGTSDNSTSYQYLLQRHGY